MPQPGWMLLGQEMSWVEAGRAGGKRRGNREHHMGTVSSAMSHLGKWGLLNPRATWDKGLTATLRALPCPGPKRLPAAPHRGTSLQAVESTLMPHPSLRDALLPPSMATGCRTVSWVGSTCPQEEGTALEQRWFPL